MVTNQRQLFIVVSDWGSYLGSHFPLVFVGSWSMFSCLSALFLKLHVSFVHVCFDLLSFSFIKNMWNSTHSAPWSHLYNERDRRSHQQLTKQRVQEE